MDLQFYRAHFNILGETIYCYQNGARPPVRPSVKKATAVAKTICRLAVLENSFRVLLFNSSFARYQGLWFDLENEVEV